MEPKTTQQGTQQISSLSGDSQMFRRDIELDDDAIEINYNYERAKDFDNFQSLMDDFKNFTGAQTRDFDPEDRLGYERAFIKDINKNMNLPYKIAEFTGIDGNRTWGFMSKVDESTPLTYIPPTSNRGALFYRNFADGTREPLTQKEFEELKAQKNSGEMVQDIPMYEVPTSPDNLNIQGLNMAEIRAREGIIPANLKIQREVYKKAKKGIQKL